MAQGSANTLKDWLQTVVFGRKPGWTLVRIIALVLTTIILHRYVFMLRKIESTSMLPGFREGSVHLIHRLAYLRHPPERGDVVAVRTSGETVMYIKRIVGLPGERLAIRHGTVWIGDQALDEPYVRLPRRTDWERLPITLGTNEYYVIGDNRSMAKEQHEFGRIEHERILGKVLW